MQTIESAFLFNQSSSMPLAPIQSTFSPRCVVFRRLQASSSSLFDFVGQSGRLWARVEVGFFFSGVDLRIEIDTAVGELAEGSLLLELGGLLSVLEKGGTVSWWFS